MVPYFGYARADRKVHGRESIAAKLVANLLTEAGIDRMLSIDLHSGQCVGYFDIPVDHVYGETVLLDYLASKQISNGAFLRQCGMRDGVRAHGCVKHDHLPKHQSMHSGNSLKVQRVHHGKACTRFTPAGDLVVVSPDVGGVARARAFAKKLSDAPLAIVDKRRSAHNVSEVMNVIGDVEGKVAVLVDDMIDTAGTITNAAKVLKDEGAKAVYACSTHAVFSPPAIDRLSSGVFLCVECQAACNTVVISMSARQRLSCSCGAHQSFLSVFT